MRNDVVQAFGGRRGWAGTAACLKPPPVARQQAIEWRGRMPRGHTRCRQAASYDWDTQALSENVMR